MKVIDGKKVLDFEGVFIEVNEENGSGIFISNDSKCDFDYYECMGDTGEIEVNGTTFKWGVLYS